jgi:hypothetical protein
VTQGVGSEFNPQYCKKKKSKISYAFADMYNLAYNEDYDDDNNNGT